MLLAELQTLEARAAAIPVGGPVALPIPVGGPAAIPVGGPERGGAAAIIPAGGPGRGGAEGIPGGAIEREGAEVRLPQEECAGVGAAEAGRALEVSSPIVPAQADSALSRIATTAAADAVAPSSGLLFCM